MLAFMIQQHVRRDIDSPAPEWLGDLLAWSLGGVPQLVQLWGGVFAALVGLAVAALIWWRRHWILQWWNRSSRQFKWTLGGAVLTAVVFFVLAGALTWDYMQHDNDFCNSCHVMNEPFEKFQSSEHSELQCHDCHQQSMYASARQVYLWVADRPEEIGPHAPVPREICVQCHVTEDPDSTWQRISTTVGHRVHLEADTSALADVSCVTCHGVEVHRFAPADQTCGQSGCHEPGKTEVVLGRMAGQTGFHCVTCHEFTAPVAERTPLDTVRMDFVPALENCRNCHEMENLLVGLDPERDPHDAVCGTCHNPHTQEAPEEASERCAECHAPAEELTPFHRGIEQAVLEDCVGCHEAHTFLVEGENCVACHADIVGGTPTAGPRAPGRISSRPGAETLARTPAPHGAVATTGPNPHPFYADGATSRTGGMDRRDGGPAGSGVPLIRASTDGTPSRGVDPAIVGTYVTMRLGEETAAELLQQQQARFNHRDHEDIECTDCHTSQQTHGQVTVESRTQCLECHHTRPVVDRGCARCHGTSGVTGTRPVTLRMDIRGRTSQRRVAFDHNEHAGVGCAQCHTQGVSKGVSRDCASCHDNHHTAEASCVTCHDLPAQAAHTREVHTRGCAGSNCHDSSTYGAMTRGRNTCLSCHQQQVDHRPGQQCARCHQVTFATTMDAATAVGRGR